MIEAMDGLMQAMKKAVAGRPKVGGFPYLAECLRQAGVRRNVWTLPACQHMYLMERGAVMMQGRPLIAEPMEVPKFDREALIKTLRTDQAGESTLEEFLEGSWRAGVVRYEVNFVARKVTYFGAGDEEYVEEYTAVEVG